MSNRTHCCWSSSTRPSRNTTNDRHEFTKTNETCFSIRPSDPLLISAKCYVCHYCYNCYLPPAIPRLLLLPFTTSTSSMKSRDPTSTASSTTAGTKRRLQLLLQHRPAAGMAGSGGVPTARGGAGHHQLQEGKATLVILSGAWLNGVV